MKLPALVAAVLVIALAACAQHPRHCSLVDLDWCNPANPQLPEAKPNWP
jgi:hypothetical protein